MGRRLVTGYMVLLLLLLMLTLILEIARAVSADRRGAVNPERVTSRCFGPVVKKGGKTCVDFGEASVVGVVVRSAVVVPVLRSAVVVVVQDVALCGRFA